MFDIVPVHVYKLLVAIMTLALSLSVLVQPTYPQSKRPRTVSTNAPSKTSPAPSKKRSVAATRPLRIINPQAVDALSVDPTAYKQLVRDYLQLAQEVDNYTKKLETERRAFPFKLFWEFLKAAGFSLGEDIVHRLDPGNSDLIKLIHYKTLLEFFYDEAHAMLERDIEFDNLEARLRELDTRATALGLWSDLARAGFFSPPDDALAFTVDSVSEIDQTEKLTIVSNDGCDVPKITNMNPAARMALCVSRQLLTAAQQVSDPKLKMFLLTASGATIHEVGGPINFQQVISLWQAYRSLADGEGADLSKQQEQLEERLGHARSSEEIEAIMSALDKLGDDIEKFNAKVKRLIWTNLRVSAPNEYIPILKGNEKGKPGPDVVSSPAKPHRLSRLTITNQTGAEIVLLIGQEAFRLAPAETISKQLPADGYFVAAWLPFPPSQRNIVEGHSFLVLEEGKAYRASVAIASKAK
jgi:hypothetical protein